MEKLTVARLAPMVTPTVLVVVILVAVAITKD
jgi:hypothetical protein